MDLSTADYSSNRPRRMSAVEACDLMTELLRKEGVMVSPLDVRELISKHWHRLSMLAHAIHDGC